MTFAILAVAAFSVPASAQDVTYRSAVVALVDDAELRASFEHDLVEKAREHRYDAVSSYEITSDIDEVDNRRFVSALTSRGIQAVLMVRPASVGPGSSLESVRNQVSPDVYSNMRAFAREVSSSGPDDLIAIVHLAIYTLDGRDATLVSGGAVWLDEDVESREEGISRLQDLIVANVDAARPTIRSYLGLPPLQ